MACIKLKSQWGERLIPEGHPYRLLKGEEIIGTVWDCGAKVAQDEVERKLEEAGIHWGDAVAWVAKKMGKKECARCAADRFLLNNVDKVGWGETISAIKETFRG